MSPGSVRPTPSNTARTARLSTEYCRVPPKRDLARQARFRRFHAGQAVRAHDRRRPRLMAVAPILQRHWRRSPTPSPLSVLAKHLFGGGKWAGRRRGRVSQLLQPPYPRAPFPQLALSWNVLLQQRNHLGGNRPLLQARPLTQRFVQLVRHVLDV